MEDDIAPQVSITVDRVEKELATSLKQKDPPYPGLETKLAKFRSVCQDCIFADFEAAAQKKVEHRLWDAHSKVNKTFRGCLAKFRDGDGKKKHVERRKAEKLYLDFIKSSMRFYRGYIQRLASNFANVPEVFEVAQKFHLETFSADTPQQVDLALKKQIVRSCYLTLIQLGDLSRYRETELQTKERNWGPAKGYYDLAIALDPTSGMSYNQLAVIALTDQDHLRAVYYLYRAISVANPAPQAEGNIQIEFKKVRTKMIQGKPVSAGEAAIDCSSDLQHRFILFHARCFEPHFPNHEEQQAEILSLLADDLRERPFDTVIRKLCLINIAAERYAGNQVAGFDSDDSAALQSYERLQQFNISCFFMLLKLLLDELQQLAKSANYTSSSAPAEHSQMSPVIRRILPHLRVYSGWLLSTVQFLLVSRSAKVQLSELWQVYAEALSLLVQSFPITTIPEIPYLLDEDQDTVAFTPFEAFVREKRFQGSAKPPYSEAGFGKRSPEKEMLYRIKCLTKDALHLCNCKKSGDSDFDTLPLIFAGMRIVYTGQGGLHVEDSSMGSSMHANSSVGSISRDDIEHAKSSINAIGRRRNHHEGMSEASATSTMENMVNDLTEQDGTELVGVYKGTSTPSLKTPVVQSFAERGLQPQPTTITAHDIVQSFRHSTGSLAGLQGQIDDQPTIPPVWNTPFTPRPGETGSSPRPSTAKQISTAAMPSHVNSAAQFNAQITHMQQQIQLRSSPLESFQPTMSNHYDTPTNLTSWIRHKDQSQSPLSPWQDSGQVWGTVIPTRSPEPAPFGAIGEARPRSSRESYEWSRRLT